MKLLLVILVLLIPFVSLLQVIMITVKCRESERKMHEKEHAWIKESEE